MSKFHQQLKECRNKNNLTQKDLASLLQVTYRAIQNYEAGYREPNLDTLIFLADYFSVSLDYLLGRKNENGTRLFTHPTGTVDYSFYGSAGTNLTGTFEYCFGAFFFNDLLIKFLYLQDSVGDFISKIQSTEGTMEFLSLVALVNDKLKLGYDLSKQKNGLHKVDFIVRTDELPPRFKRLFLNTQGEVVIENITWEGYEKFISDYIEWTNEKKVKFLANNIPS